MSQILIADIPAAHELLAACFPDANVTFAETFGEACDALSKQRYDIVVVGIDFDTLRVFDLLAVLRQHRSTSVVCVKALATYHSYETLASVKAAVKALGADAFLDLTEYEESELCEVLLSALSGKQR